MHPPGSVYRQICDRKREILAFRHSVLTYQLSLYQHKQIHANPSRVSAAQVAALDARLHLLQLIPHN